MNAPPLGRGKQSVWLATRADKRVLRAVAHTHFGRPEGRKAERRNVKFTPCRNYDAVDKENTVPRRTEESTHVWPCGPLCRADGGWVASVPTNSCFRPASGSCGKRSRPALTFLLKWQDDMRFSHNDWTHFRRRISMLLEVNRRTKSIAGENPGAFIAPGRSLPPAVRAVSGDGG